MTACLEIRPAAPDDAAGIAHVHVSSWRTTYRGILPDVVLDGLDEGRRTMSQGNRLLNPPDGERTFVAVADGGIVGFAVCGPARVPIERYSGEIYGLYLVQSYQRMGIGRALVRQAVRALAEDGHRSIYLWVLQRNPSRAFYEALGGLPLRRKMIHIAGVRRMEVAYGWTDLSALMAGHPVATGDTPGTGV